MTHALLLTLVILAADGAGDAASVPAGDRAQSPGSTSPLEADNYAIRLAAKGPYSVGRQGAVIVTVNARKGFHVNAGFPVTFKPEGSVGLELAAQRLKVTADRKTLCEGSTEDACAAEYSVPVTPARRGSVKLAGTFSFSVCTSRTCVIKKVQIALPLQVD